MMGQSAADAHQQALAAYAHASGQPMPTMMMPSQPGMMVQQQMQQMQPWMVQQPGMLQPGMMQPGMMLQQPGMLPPMQPMPPLSMPPLSTPLQLPPLTRRVQRSRSPYSSPPCQRH